MKRSIPPFAQSFAIYLIAVTALGAKEYQTSDFRFGQIEEPPVDGAPFYYQEINPEDGLAPILIPLNCLNGQPEVQELVHLTKRELLLVSYDAGSMGSIMQIAVSHLAIYDLKARKIIFNDRIASTKIADYTEAQRRYKLRRLYTKALKGAPSALDTFTSNAQDNTTEGYGSYLLGEYWRGRDNALALEHYTQAAKQGSGDAAFALAEYFYSERANQTVVKPDPTKAFELYKQAAVAEHVDACLRLAEHYEKHPDAAEADQASALFWYDNAAEAGLARAMEKFKELAGK